MWVVIGALIFIGVVVYSMSPTEPPVEQPVRRGVKRGASDELINLLTVTMTTTITDDETGEVEVIEVTDKPKRGGKRMRTEKRKRTVHTGDGAVLEVVEWEEKGKSTLP